MMCHHVCGAAAYQVVQRGLCVSVTGDTQGNDVSTRCHPVMEIPVRVVVIALQPTTLSTASAMLGGKVSYILECKGVWNIKVSAWHNKMHPDCHSMIMPISILGL